MNKRSLAVLVRIGPGLSLSLGLLLLGIWLILWVLPGLSQQRVSALTGMAVNGQSNAAHISDLATINRLRDRQPITKTVVPADETQGVPADLVVWRNWQELPPTVQAKVDPHILAELRGDVVPAHLGGIPAQEAVQRQHSTPLETTRFFVYLHEQPDVTELETMVFASQISQRTALLQSLRATAIEQQAALRSLLDLRLQEATVTAYQPFFLVNAIVVEGGLNVVNELAQRSDVARLVANYPLLSDATFNASANVQSGAVPQAEDARPPSATEITASADEAVNWNIALVRADEVWRDFGVRGEGAVVASFDTGVYFEHPALVEQYRGNLGNGNFNHNYNWFEPDGNLYANGDLGPSVSQEPEACSSHGTHTVGTMLGDGGTERSQVGLAPAATWIALPGICWNTMGGGLQDDIGGLKAFQWILCPTDLTGDLESADCSKAPDVVNNSWGSANPAADTFRPIIRMLRAANIAPVFAAGNPFAGDGSIGTPANAPEAITVGATDQYDSVAYFSGRGPSYYPGEQKPELSAPGVDVYSAVGISGYDSASGTSMAAPHVTGLIALMVSADLKDGVRDLTVDEIETFMIRTAVDLGVAGPDNSFGYGRIDAYEAVNAVLNAGDLRGVVRNAETSMPLADVAVTGQSGTATFHIATDAQGAYALTVPAGRYDLLISAWGYTQGRFSGQLVFESSQSLADFILQPLPIVNVSGSVLGDGTPIGDVSISVKEQPIVTTQSASDGGYTLALPVGTHTLVVEKSGYRVQEVAVTVTNGAAQTQNLLLVRAPTLLLIEADAYRGWFDGWPIDRFFRTALEEHGYSYAFWPIQYLDEKDTFIREDGSTGYGLPSLGTLQEYDVVIWAQSGCSASGYGCYFSNGPSRLGALETLESYMDGGGRIIFSGQDIGFWEDGGTLFTEYLYTSLLDDDAAGAGDGLTGMGFLEDLHITVTNASLYGYRNGIVSLAPDAIAAESPLAAENQSNGTFAANVFPILQYNNTQLPAAIAVDACAADYRAVYLGMGYENVAHRADYRGADITELLNRSITWVHGERTGLELDAVAIEPLQFAIPGTTADYELRMANTGGETFAVQLNETNGRWPLEFWFNGERLQGSFTLAPCEAATVLARIAVPDSTDIGARDQTTVTISATAVNGGAAVTQDFGLATGAYGTWAAISSMPTARHQFGVAPVDIGATAGTALHLIGGWRNSLSSEAYPPQRALADNSRLNICSRQWEDRAPLPEPRAGMAVTTVGGQIYVIGGGSQVVRYSYDSIDTHQTVWRYDPTTDAWTELAPLPVALVGASAAAVDGKVYVFGGMIFGYVIGDFGLGWLTTNLINRVTYIYDPVTNSWSTGTSNPGKGHFFGAAASFGDKILVAGGWPDVNSVHIYTPATNSWREGAPLLQGRHSFGMALMEENGESLLYAIGGAIEQEGIRTVERYVPSLDQWESLPMLRDDGRYGVGAGYGAGQLLALGGATAVRSSETLVLADSFCNSTYQAVEAILGVDQPIRYEVVVQSDVVDLPNASFSHTLADNTVFTGFISNTLGAQYDASTRTVFWRGAVKAGQPLPPVRYAVAATETLRQQISNVRAARDEAVQPGTEIQSEILFDNGNGLVFTRTATAIFLATDIDGSWKEIDRSAIRSGDPVTYTVTVLGNNIVNSDVTLRDPLPANMRYVPDSLRVSSGEGQYNAATHTVEWAGRTSRAAGALVNLTTNYLWGDSDVQGAKGGVPYEWIEISETGNAATAGDWIYRCYLPIGFDFPFYGQVERNFCVSTNGFISFDTYGHSGDLYNSCPMGDPTDNHSVIAAIWDDLVVEDMIYYQTMGTAPNRYLVVQWSGVRRYGSPGSNLATFQAVLFEDGTIRIAIKKAGELTGRSSTTGLEDRTETLGATYGCNESGLLHDKLAILFVPPNQSIGAAYAEVQFQAVAEGDLTNGTALSGDPALPVNQPVKNTVYITLAENQIAREATTLLNPLDLNNSTFTVDQPEIVPAGLVTYTLLMQNAGLIAAKDATLTVDLPSPLAYAAGTLTCASGSCQAVDGQTLQWSGVISPQLPLTLTFAARLTAGIPDRTPLVATATLDDGYGSTYEFAVNLLARRSDLSRSQFAFMPSAGEPGYKVALMGVLQNAGGLATNAQVTITVPANLIYVEESLVCGTGSCTLAQSESAHVIRWQGPLAARQAVPIRLTLQIPPDSAYGDSFRAKFDLRDVDWAEDVVHEANLTTMHTLILPLIAGEYQEHVLFIPLVIQDE